MKKEKEKEIGVKTKAHKTTKRALIHLEYNVPLGDFVKTN